MQKALGSFSRTGTLLPRRNRLILSGSSRNITTSSKNSWNSSSLRFASTQAAAATATRPSIAVVDSSLPQYLLKTPPYQQTTLSNQIRVASEENHGEIATIAVWIDAGSVYETKENNGTAHFLEHMAFKGTNRRTRIQLEQEIEDMGGSLNAYTSREQTMFQLKAFKNDVPKAMDILSDILLNSKYDQAAIEQERGTILREYEEVSKETHEVIFDHLHTAAFQGHPLGRTILGSKENIRKISRDDLTNYVKQHYTGNRMVVTGAGAVKHDELVSLTDKLFSKLPAAQSLTQNPANVPLARVPWTGSSLEVRDDAMEELHFILAHEGIPASHPDYFTFMVIQQLIGSWDRTVGGGKNLSSRLCEIVATEEIAHSITSFNTVYRDTGLFGVYATCKPEKSEDLAFEIMNEFTRLGKIPTELEVDRAKARLKASVLMNLDGTVAVVEDIGRQLLTHGRRLTPAETVMRINAVTAKDVMRVATEHTWDKEPVLVYVGPTKLAPEYHRIRGWSYWNRW
eukprot:TRINITY_DN34_c0_g1_i1.p1 TRINITY_DN34_c0_g1~~TRINITY_DN34_c0_g1_i1.p1  ORF type:complete len:513 (-),score=143.21 TRINITY_DN34_c0_g1_i1:115-1653(-)